MMWLVRLVVVGGVVGVVVGGGVAVAVITSGRGGVQQQPYRGNSSSLISPPADPGSILSSFQLLISVFLTPLLLFLIS